MVLSVGVSEDLVVGVTGSMAWGGGDTKDLAFGDTEALLVGDTRELVDPFSGVTSLVSFPGDLSLAGWCDWVILEEEPDTLASKSRSLKLGVILETVIGYQILVE